jgi:TIR domain
MNFLDLNPERGLKAGQRWQDALKKTAERCEVVLFLISPAWAASKWCLAEFLVAKQIGKPILGVIVAPTPSLEIPIEMMADWQLVDLRPPVRDPDRAPYRGLKSLKAKVLVRVRRQVFGHSILMNGEDLMSARKKNRPPRAGHRVLAYMNFPNAGRTYRLASNLRNRRSPLRRVGGRLRSP